MPIKIMYTKLGGKMEELINAAELIEAVAVQTEAMANKLKDMDQIEAKSEALGLYKAAVLVMQIANDMKDDQNEK